MAKELSQDELWKIYELLPEDLKDAIFSMETSDNITLACKLAGIEDERESKVAKLTGRVLLGLMAPDKFQTALQQEVGLNDQEAKKISHQIHRLIFNRVKESLALLYGYEAVQGQTQSLQTESSIKEIRKQPEGPKTIDPYREVPE